MTASYRWESASSLPDLLPHVKAWEELATQSLDDNLYVSPAFFLTLLRHVGSHTPFSVLFTYRHHDDKDHLIGCAPFTIQPPTWKIPFTVLSTFQNPYCYLPQPLLHKHFAEDAATMIVHWIDRPEQPWKIVLFSKVLSSSATWSLIRERFERSGHRSWIKDTYSRAHLRRRESFDAHLALLSPSRRKRLRRKWRALHAAGDVQVILHRNLDDTPDIADRFMSIEQRSWKGTRDSAMRQTLADRNFFSSVVDALAAGDQLFFVELRLNNEPVSISANFVHARTLFCFKIAYDPGFRQFSPGILNEIAMLRLFHQFPTLVAADSGADGPSYLDAYWHDSTELQVVFVPTGGYRARMYLRVAAVAMRVKRLLITLYWKAAGLLVAERAREP